MYGAAAVLALTVASTIAQAIGAGSQQKAYAQYQIAQTKAELANYMQQVNQQNTRYAQEVEAANQQEQQVYLDNLQAKATAQASAAGSGVEGSSIDNLFRGYERATALSDFINERNLRNIGLQYDTNFNALRANALSAINTQSQYTGETFGSTLLGGFGGILSTTSNVANQRFNKTT